VQEPLAAVEAGWAVAADALREPSRSVLAAAGEQRTMELERMAAVEAARAAARCGPSKQFHPTTARTRRPQDPHANPALHPSSASPDSPLAKTVAVAGRQDQPPPQRPCMPSLNAAPLAGTSRVSTSSPSWATARRDSIQGAFGDEIAGCFDIVGLLTAEPETVVVDGQAVKRMSRRLQVFPDRKHDWLKDRYGALGLEFPINMDDDYARMIAAIEARRASGTAVTTQDVSPAEVVGDGPAGEPELVDAI
jgi:hypothetical protein